MKTKTSTPNPTMSSNLDLRVSVQLNGNPIFRSPHLALSSDRVRAIQDIIDRCAQDVEYQLTRAGPDERRDAEQDKRFQRDMRDHLGTSSLAWDSRF